MAPPVPQNQNMRKAGEKDSRLSTNAGVYSIDFNKACKELGVPNDPKRPVSKRFLDSLRNHYGGPNRGPLADDAGASRVRVQPQRPCLSAESLSDRRWAPNSLPRSVCTGSPETSKYPMSFSPKSFLKWILGGQILPRMMGRSSKPSQPRRSWT